MPASPSTFKAYHCDQTGRRLSEIRNWHELQFTHSLGEVGEGKITVPNTSRNNYQPYDRIHIYRAQAYTNYSVTTGTQSGIKENFVFGFFILRLDYETKDNGIFLLSLSGMGLGQYILSSRVVAYREQTANTKKSADYADDVMKDLVRENLGSSSVTDYDGNSITTRNLAAYITVETDVSAGVLVSWEGAWKSLHEELQGIQKASVIGGEEMFFGIELITDTALVFRTRPTIWGRYKANVGNTPNGLLFSKEQGSLSGGMLTIDHMREANAVYGLWSGTGSQRNIIEADRESVLGVFSRRERAVNVSRAETEEMAELAIYNELMTKRPTIRFSGRIVSTPSTPFGFDGWLLGDIVTISYTMNYEANNIFGIVINDQKYIADVMIRRVNVRVDSNGMENITGDIESVAVRQVGI